MLFCFVCDCPGATGPDYVPKICILTFLGMSDSPVLWLFICKCAASLSHNLTRRLFDLYINSRCWSKLIRQKLCTFGEGLCRDGFHSRKISIPRVLFILVLAALQLFTVCQKLIHKGFNGNTQNGSDIAFLILGQEAVHHKPISEMSEEPQDFIRTNCSELTSIGWFSPRLNGPPSPIMEVLPKLTIKPQEECAAVFENMPSRTICAVSDLTTNIVCKWTCFPPPASY